MEYYKAKATLDEIAVRINSNANRLTSARSVIANAEADLLAMESLYGQFVGDLDVVAQANPSDEVWQRAKEEKDKLVSEFVALKATATAQLGALDNL
jgi:hypothetical protein